jgi:hypothetical protein
MPADPDTQAPVWVDPNTQAPAWADPNTQSRRGRLAEFSAAPGAAKAIRRATLSLARAPVPSSELWATIERAGTLSLIVGALESPEDIGNAAAVSRRWRGAVKLSGDAVWARACHGFPLLQLVIAEAWCAGSCRSKALLVQQQQAKYVARQTPAGASLSRPAGPRKQEEHFSVVPLKAPAPPGHPVRAYAIPAGSERATRAQVEQNDVLRRIQLNGKICLLDGEDALFPSRTGPAQPANWELAQVGTARAAALGKFGRPWSEDSSWFDIRLLQAKDMPGMMHVSEVVARCNPTTFIRGMLDEDVLTLAKTAASLRAIAAGQELAPTKAAASTALGISLEIVRRKNLDVRKRPALASVHRADLHEFDAHLTTGAQALRLPIADQLLYSTTPRTKLCVLETFTIRNDFLLGVEVRMPGRQVLYANLCELPSLCTGQDASCLHALNIHDVHSWPGSEPPRVSVFLLRKSDGSRLDLTVDSADSNAYQDDYDSTIVFINRFGVADTGRYGGLCNLLRFEVVSAKRGRHLSSVSVRLDGGGYNAYDDWLVRSVEWMLHMLSSPGFASRWVAPLRTRRVRRLAPVVLAVPRQANPYDLLRTTVIAAAKPPPLMALVLKHLDEVKLMVRASEVCRDWYAAVNHREAWSRLLETYPMLAKIREYSDGVLPVCSTKSLFIQQTKSHRVMSSELVRPPRTDYRLGVELYDVDVLKHASLADISTAAPKADFYAEDSTELLTEVTFADGETIEYDSSELRLVVSAFRKRDGKRITLIDHPTSDADGDEIYFDGGLSAANFEIFDQSVSTGCESSVPAVHFDVNLHLKPFEENEGGTRALKSLDINMGAASTSDDQLSMCCVDGMIQLLECPGFADLWK